MLPLPCRIYHVQYVSFVAVYDAIVIVTHRLDVHGGTILFCLWCWGVNIAVVLMVTHVLTKNTF
jgi:hypothetical protein